MKPIIAARWAGNTPCVGWPNLSDLLEDTYKVQHRNEFFKNRAGYIKCVQSTWEENQRWEAFLWSDDEFRVIGGCVYCPTWDIHYGLVASPMGILLHSDYQNNRSVLRELREIKHTVLQRMGATKYLDVKHISSTEQRVLLKEV